MIKKLTHNLGWKLLSLVFAFLLWLTVINYEDPQITKVFTNIPVEKVNEQVITSTRKAIDYIDGNTITVKVRGKRSVVDGLSLSDIKASADLKRMSVTGAVEIMVDIGKEVQVIDKSPATMLVELERVISVQKEIQFYKEGDVKKGYVALDPLIMPNKVEIEGPASQIARIKSVLVPINIEGISKDLTLYTKPQIMDDDNNLVAELDMNVKQVQVRVAVQKLKEVPLRFEERGELPKGYQLMGIQLSSDRVMVRGPEKVIDKLEAIDIDTVDFSQLTNSSKKEVALSSLLPDGVVLYQDEKMVEVMINIEKVIDKQFDFEPSEIEVLSLPEKTKLEIKNDQPLTVVYRGVTSLIEAIEVSAIRPRVDLKDLESGEHQVKVDFIPVEGAMIVSPEVGLRVTLEKNEQAD